MSSSEQKSRPTFTGITPVVSVTNVSDALDYYVERLGFEKVWGWSDGTQEFGTEQPDFACVRRGSVSFFLDHGTQGKPGSWYYLDVESLDDLDALHLEYQQSGARITSPPEDKSWGMREMLVEDPDGNVFRVGAGL